MFLHYLFLNEIWLPEDAQLLHYVSSGRRKKVLRLRFDKDRRLSLYAALLAQKMIRDLAGLTQDQLCFQTERQGKPVLKVRDSSTSVFINISHADGCAVCGLSLDQELGVDVERIRPAPFSIMSRCFHPEELAFVETGSGDSDKRFFEVWTRKEALLKKNGTGLTEGLTSMNALHPEADAIQSFHKSNYIISTCTSNPEPVILSNITEAELRAYYLAIPSELS